MEVEGVWMGLIEWFMIDVVGVMMTTLTVGRSIVVFPIRNYV